MADLDDGTRLEWGFNPESFEDSDSAGFARVSIPGMSHPRIQFTGGGERTLSFVIPLHYSQCDVARDIRTLRAWLYGEYTGGRLVKAPHRLLVQFGGTWQGEKWLMESLDVSYKRFGKDGGPIMADASVTLVEYAETSKGIGEVRAG
ncbi:MAG: phage tail protein, partial [Synergistaceae bacterium]|jgi:hypothetical protein|nr:phage tail protein [Synergistaceae bacterium]